VWRCPKCMEYNGDTLGACTKCAAGRPSFDPDETALDGVIDRNRPVPIAENNSVQCPTCGDQFKVQVLRETASRVFSKKVENALCPACARPVTPETLVRISATVRESSAVKEVLLACPYCGKIVGVTAT